MKTVDKESFLTKYKLKEFYKEELISWDTIQKIYDDFQQKSNELEEVRTEVLKLLNEKLKGNYHSIESRVKDAEHLIEKIIRKICIENNYKYNNICENDYYEIIRDLIGVRVLVFSKEGWEKIHDGLCDVFKTEDNAGKEFLYYMKEVPEAYIRYGDRDVFHNKIHTQYSNKGYRSQHYIIAYNKYYCEIQVRTIAEEVYGEFDHKVRYPYRKDNKFLLRYTTTMAQLMAVADELVSTCLQMPAELWDQCDSAFGDDVFADWARRNQPPSADAKKGDLTMSLDARTIANNKILRRKGD